MLIFFKETLRLSKKKENGIIEGDYVVRAIKLATVPIADTTASIFPPIRAGVLSFHQPHSLTANPMIVNIIKILYMISIFSPFFICRLKHLPPGSEVFTTPCSIVYRVELPGAFFLRQLPLLYIYNIKPFVFPKCKQKKKEFKNYGNTGILFPFLII